MSKLMKKVLSIVAAIAMVLTMAVPVAAASITINPQNPDGTASNTTEYHYYQLLDATISGTNVAYSVPVSESGTTLKNLLDTVTITKNENAVDVFSFTQSADGKKWVATVNTAITEDDGNALAEALNTDAIKTAALAMGTFLQSAETSAKASNLANGYYLITSNLGTVLVAQTLGDVTINTKNSYPSLVKTEDKENLKTGDTVTYTLTVAVPTSAIVGNTITVHDTLDSHLTANTDSIAAKLGETTVTLTDADTKTDETFAKSFTITDAMLGQNVVITYSAELKDEAAADTAYKNSAYLNYANYETKPSEVEVKTFDIDLTKTFTGSSEKSDLQATFELRTNAENKNTALQFVTDNTGYVVADSTATTGKSATITAKDDTVVNIRGLATGTYYLVETSTADGYNALTNAITVTVDENGNATFSGTGSTSENNAVTVENKAGSTLPSTGGMGTTIFYVLGAALVIGAGVVLVTRRKLS